MFGVDMALIWGIVAVVAIIVELFTLDFTFLIVGLASAGTALSAVVNAPIAIQIVIFIILGLVGLLTLRPLARKHLKLTKTTKTNVDRVPGQRGKVIETVTVDNGLVFLDGEQWSARLDRDISDVPVSEGTEVTVTRVDGATLLVHALD